MRGVVRGRGAICGVFCVPHLNYQRNVMIKYIVALLAMLFVSSVVYAEEAPSKMSKGEMTAILTAGVVLSAYAIQEEPSLWGAMVILAGVNQPSGRTETQVQVEGLSLLALGLYNITELSGSDVSKERRIRENVLALGAIALASYSLGKSFPEKVNKNMNEIYWGLSDKEFSINKRWEF